MAGFRYIRVLGIFLMLSRLIEQKFLLSNRQGRVNNVDSTQPIAEHLWF